MSINRRALLSLLALGATGCAGSPVVLGAPAAPATQPVVEPTRSAAAEAAHASLAELRALLDALSNSPHWENQAWAGAAMAQTDAQLARLVVADPLSLQEQDPVFDVRIDAAHPPSDAIVALNRLNDTVARTVDSLERAAAAAEGAGLRLLYASISAAVLGLHDQSVAPVEATATPRALQETTVEASMPLLLGHVWALIYGLGVGLGRLPADDAAYAIGSARLTEARGLRNQLREELGSATPDQPAAFELPTPMDTPAAILTAWGALELNVLDGYARLVAADADPRWRRDMLGQVGPVQATATPLPWWPGWRE